MLLFGLPIRLIGAVFALVVHTYLIYSAWAKMFSRLRFFVLFPVFSSLLFAFLLAPLVCHLWPPFGLIFSSILLHFCPVSPSLFTAFVVFCLLLPAPWLSN